MARLIEERRERIKNLLDYAHTQSINGIEPKLITKAKVDYRVTDKTASDYASTVVAILKSEQKEAP